MKGQPGGSRDDATDFVAPASLYVHVPLCVSKCSYCDFYSISASTLSEGFEKELVEATLARANSLADRFGADGFDTVYIGGGTPSILSPSALERLLEGIENLAMGGSRSGLGEWTVEANPDSLRTESLEIMKRHGVTRLSVGVQSLGPGELATLGRRHGPDEALGALRLATQSGMSVSADLIAGVPIPGEASDYGFDADKLASFARRLKSAGAAHISVYDLTLEEGSPLALARGRYRFPTEDEEWESRRKLEAFLAEAGMRRYEVSNYAAVGDECRHNLAYWRMDSYLGAGPGAVSTIALRSGGSLRIEEPRDMTGYWLAAEKAAETEISSQDAAFESIMMAFRTSFGLDLGGFRERFGIDAEALIGDTLAKWGDRIAIGEPWPGCARSCGPALTGEGLDILNRFLCDCLTEIDRRRPRIAPEKRQSDFCRRGCAIY